jgi:hypothetical protein
MMKRTLHDADWNFLCGARDALIEARGIVTANVPNDFKVEQITELLNQYVGEMDRQIEIAGRFIRAEKEKAAPIQN